MKRRWPMTYAAFCKLPLRGSYHMTMSHQGILVQVNDEHGIERVIVTPRNEKSGRWGYGKARYFLAGDDRQFANAAELYVAYMALACPKEAARWCATPATRSP